MVFPLLIEAVQLGINFTNLDELWSLDLEAPVEGDGHLGTTFCGTVGFRTRGGQRIPGLVSLSSEPTEVPANGQLK